MNQHATQRGDAPSGSHQPLPEEEDADNPCCPSLSTSEMKEVLHQLDEIHYQPAKDTLHRIFKYADIPPKCPD